MLFNKRFIYLSPGAPSENPTLEAEALGKTLEGVTNQAVINLIASLEGEKDLSGKEVQILKDMAILDSSSNITQEKRAETFSGNTEKIVNSDLFGKFLQVLKEKRPDLYEEYQSFVGKRKEAVEAVAEEIETILEEQRIHVVTTGDTLSKIAKNYGTTLAKLLELNKHISGRSHGKLKGADYIILGEKIVVGALPRTEEEVTATTEARSVITAEGEPGTVEAIPPRIRKSQESSEEIPSEGEKRESAITQMEAEERAKIVESVLENPGSELLQVKSKIPDSFKQVQVLALPGEEAREVRIGTSEIEWSTYLQHMEGGGRNFYGLWEQMSSLDFGETRQEALKRLRGQKQEIRKAKRKGEITKEEATEKLAQVEKIEEIVNMLYPRKRPKAESPTTLFIECLRKIEGNQRTTLTFNDISMTMLGMHGRAVLNQYQELKAQLDTIKDPETKALIEVRLEQLELFIAYSKQILDVFPDLSLEPLIRDESELPPKETRTSYEDAESKMEEIEGTIYLDNRMYQLSEIVPGASAMNDITLSHSLAIEMTDRTQRVLDRIRDDLPEDSPFKDPNFDVDKKIKHNLYLRAIIQSCGYENLIEQGTIVKVHRKVMERELFALKELPAGSDRAVEYLISQMFLKESKKKPKYSTRFTDQELKVARYKYEDRKSSLENPEETIDWNKVIGEQLDIIFDRTDLGPEIRRRAGDGLRRRKKKDVINMELLARKTPGERTTYSGQHAFELTRAQMGEYQESGEFILNPEAVLEELNYLIISGINGAATNDELLAQIGIENRATLIHSLRAYLDAEGDTDTKKLQYIEDNPEKYPLADINMLREIDIDKFMLESIDVSNHIGNTITDFQIALIRRGFEFESTLDGALDSIESREIALNAFDPTTNEILAATYQAAREQGVEVSAEDLIEAGERIQHAFVAGGGIMVDVVDIYQEQPNGPPEFIKTRLDTAFSAQTGIPIGTTGLSVNLGILGNKPAGGIGGQWKIAETGARAGFNVTFIDPASPGRAVSLSAGITEPMGDSAWSVCAGASVGIGAEGVETPSIHVGFRLELDRKVDLKFEELTQEHQGQIDQTIEATATMLPEGLNPDEMEEIRQEITAVLSEEMWDEALGEIKPFQLTGFGISMRVPMPGHVPAIAIGPVLTFAIGGRKLVKRVRKESDLTLNALSEARIEASIREQLGGDIVFGAPVRKRGELIGSSGRLSVDSETGELEIESFSEGTMILPDTNASTLERYNDTMSEIGVNFTLNPDTNNLEMSVNNTDGFVRVVVDPKIKANLLAEPNGMELSIDPSERLVVRREDFRYPFNHFGATTHTVLTITTEPTVKRSTIEREMRHERGQATYIEYGRDGQITEYGGYEGDNLYFFEGETDEYKEVAEKHNFAREIDMESKRAAQAELMATIGSSNEELLGQGVPDLETLAIAIVNGKTKIDFRRETLAEIGDMRKVRDMFNKAAGYKLNDREFNLLMQFATNESFRNIREQSGDNPERARKMLAREIQTFALPTLTARLTSVVGETTAKQYAEKILKDTYGLSHIGALPTINPLNNEVEPLPDTTMYEILAGTMGQVGSREGLGAVELLSGSFKEYSLTSTDPIERGIARALLELKSPSPEKLNDHEFLRSPLALKVAKFLPTFMTGERASEIAAIYKNPESADYESDAFKRFKEIVAQVREAELTDQQGIEIVSDEGIGYWLKFTSVKMISGVAEECANEVQAINEDFAVYEILEEGPVAVGAETVSHVSAHSEKNYVEFGLSGTVKRREVHRPYHEQEVDAGLGENETVWAGRGPGGGGGGNLSNGNPTAPESSDGGGAPQS
ncbi:MAG: LysM domain-containing protein [Patescibacteria group bacterium]